VLKKVQEFDPVGVAARSLSECLLIQLNYFRLGDKLPGQLVKNYLPFLESRSYKKLSRELNVSLEEIEAAAKLIAGLDPKPGRNFDNSETRYITPDVFVYKVAEDYVIVVNDEGIPRLTISSFYRQLLARNGEPERKTKEFLKEKVRSATWLIKSIHQRQRTLYRVAKSIFTFQREFLESGVDGLKPLILRDVASDLGMHESTISRATTNKYVHTPLGIFELKYFFDNGFRRGDGQSVSAKTVKEKVREIIHRENSQQPMSDQAIVELLSQETINIARRTVAKYREELRVLPSSRRKSGTS
jgi:RNA polymerase sigma-54 factor